MNNPFDAMRRYAADLMSEVSPATTRRAVASALAPDVRRPRKAVVAIASVGLLGISNVALAAGANPSVPGDTLYGLDRAYEQVLDMVGLGGSHVAERLQEIDVLAQRGDLTGAAALVEETLASILAIDDSETELADFIEGVGGQPDEVAALVAKAQDDDRTGQDVAALARELGKSLGHGQQETETTTGDGEDTDIDKDTGPPAESPGATAPGQTNPSRGGNRP